MKVKKDQHMMVDNTIIKKIVDFANIKPNENVLEIGAGSGRLTRALAKKTRKMVAIEIDRAFEPELKKIKGVKVVIGNALREIEKTKFDRLVANIPYAICEPLIGRLIGIDFKLAVLTIPKGFADIFIAVKKDRKYSKISIMAQAFFNIKVMMDVPREAFDPPPRTDSVVVMLAQKNGNRLQKEVLKRQELKVKNAILRALFSANKMTKNEARKAINTLKISNKLLEKRLLDADIEELDDVLESVSKL